MFSLRFPESLIEHWAGRNSNDLSHLERIGMDARERGFLTHPEFVTLCSHKSRRNSGRCAKNSPDFIRHVTNVSFSTPDERLRIQVLTLLDGVEWPTASYLLHFCHGTYPVLDFRALWSLKVSMPKAYDFPFWSAYTVHCRAIADRNGVSMRKLDAALWQYSLKKQKSPQTSMP